MSFRKHQDGISCPGCDDRLTEGCDVIKSIYGAVKDKYPDMHCSWVHRNESEQDSAFARGESKLKWPHSKHNKLPSEAIDIFQIDQNGMAVFDPKFCNDVKKFLLSQGFDFKWGGDFKSLGDYGHFETV